MWKHNNAALILLLCSFVIAEISAVGRLKRFSSRQGFPSRRGFIRSTSQFPRVDSFRSRIPLPMMSPPRAQSFTPRIHMPPLPPRFANPFRVTITEPKPSRQLTRSDTIPSENEEDNGNSEPTNTCTSEKCQRAAKFLQNVMDTSVKPCDDFYKFVCGKYPISFPLKPRQTTRRSLNDLDEIVVGKVTDFLSGPTTSYDPEIVNLVRLLYRQCLDVDGMDRLKYDQLQMVLSFIGLPVLPIFQNNARIDLLQKTVAITKSSYIDLPFSAAVSGDHHNQLINTVVIFKPTDNGIVGSTIPLTFNCNNGEDNVKTPVEEIKVNTRNKAAFTKFVLNAMKLLRDHFGMNNIDLDNNRQLLQDLDRLFDFLYRREVIKSDPYTDSHEMKVLTLASLQKKTDKIMQGSNRMVWTKYLDDVFAGNVTPEHEFHEEDTIVVMDLEHLRKTLSLIAKTDQKIIAMAMWYDCLEKFAPVTTKALRHLYYTFRDECGLEEPAPWNTQCTNAILEKYAMAASYVFLGEQDAEIKKKNARAMTDLIIEVFKTSLKKADWINSYTKSYALEKLDRMRTYVAFPEWLKSHNDLNAFHHGDPIQHGDFVKTMLTFDRFRNKQNLRTLFKHNDPDMPAYGMYPTKVNACYMPQKNAITIPYAAMQQPWYDFGIDSMDFGSLGTVVGHEITHGFDNSGKNYDAGGNGNPWMTRDTTKKFRDGAKCFVKSFEQLRIEELNTNVNGQLTLNENIADAGGYVMAYEAYKIHKKRSNRPDMTLPGFEEYNSDKLFTIATALWLCGNYSKNYYITKRNDVHSHPPQRVNGGMMNFSEFSRIWGCSKDAPMNPKPKCKIW